MNGESRHPGVAGIGRKFGDAGVGAAQRHGGDLEPRNHVLPTLGGDLHSRRRMTDKLQGDIAPVAAQTDRTAARADPVTYGPLLEVLRIERAAEEVVVVGRPPTIDVGSSTTGVNPSELCAV